MQRQIFNSDHGPLGNLASRFGAVLAMTGLLLLSACDGGGESVTENDLPEYGKDGVPPVLESVTVQPNGVVESGDEVLIDFVASEALMTPVVYINDVRADVTGGIKNWRAVREMTDFEPEGNVTFTIVYQDVSGELGQGVSATTDGSVACYGPECVTDELGPLEGNWKLDFAGVGPAAGDTSWFSISDSGPTGVRSCWFDDTYQFGADGSFKNDQGDEAATLATTWLASEQEKAKPSDQLELARELLIRCKDSQDLRAEVLKLYEQVYADRPGIEQLIETSGLAGGKTARRALRRAQASGNVGLADAIEQRIELFGRQIHFRRQHSP